MNPLQGYMIGNGLTDPSWDMNGYIPYKFYKGTISSDVFSAVFNTCNGNFYQVEPGGPQLPASWGFFWIS